MLIGTASEDFKFNLLSGMRYVDKTDLLKTILDGQSETTFFLRPRRFGKTLTLSMIHYFVEDTRDEQLNAENRSLFQDLNIMKAGEKYTSQMTSYPVIHLTMQTVKGETFEDAWDTLKAILEDLYDENNCLLECGVLSEREKNYFLRILNGSDSSGRKATTTDYVRSLLYMTRFLTKYTGKRTVVLIDEYDVPLEHAYRQGYYNKMVSVIGPLLQNVLKTNTGNLRFAVITGCLRIAEEQIYTGLNNPIVNTVLSRRGSDAIGFTEPEVIKLLDDCNLSDHFDDIRLWYDGYRFGDTKIYNPWSVLLCMADLVEDEHASPLAHWANTSSNAIIRDLAEHADRATKDKIEKAMLGEEICFTLRDSIVYDDLFSHPDNVLNVMLSAGYLTADRMEAGLIHARIPNKEVRQIYQVQISDWFRDSLKSFDSQTMYAVMADGSAERLEEILTEEFLSAMSYFDTVEAFYHGIMLTLMQINQGFNCESKRESGAGRFDIMAQRLAKRDLAFVLEVRISDIQEHMAQDASDAVMQIERNQYFQDLKRQNYKRIVTYGIAFCGKRCCVRKGKVYE